MDMVFVCAPASRDANKYYSYAFSGTLGSGYIIGYLREHGFSCEQFLSSEHLNVRECSRAILELSPRVVGFTVYDTSYAQSVLIARELKRLRPGLIIVFGGPTPTVQGEAVLERCDAVDVCVRNQGEETALELLQMLEACAFDLADAPLESVLGLTHRRGDRFVRNPSRPERRRTLEEPDPLDRYPSPYLSGIIKDWRIGVLTARGCNQHCTFCNCAVMSNRLVFTHSPQRVVDELECISHMQGPTEPMISIFDDAFTLMPSRARQICEEIIRRDLKVSLRCITRCDRIDRELLELMHEARFDGIGFSLESATPQVLRRIGKVQAPDSEGDPEYLQEREFIDLFQKNVGHAKDLGMFVFASIMTGLPEETFEEGQRTVEMIRGMGLDFYSHNILSVYPGTPIFEDHERYGISKNALPNGIQYKTSYAYDPFRIRLAPKSSIELTAHGNHRADVKVLGFCPADRRDKGFLTSVILETDQVDEGLVTWLNRNLALNGRILQIYSNAETARTMNEPNRMLMNRCGLPTIAYTAHYRSNGHPGRTSLRSYESVMWNGQCEFPIHLVDWEAAEELEDADELAMDCVLFERGVADARALHSLLVSMAEDEETGSVPAVPFAPGLCRWESKPPSCQTLEAAIVNADGEIRPCWWGPVVGRVGDTFETLRANASALRSRVQARRGCASCARQDACARCPFPQPLGEEEYCRLQKQYDVQRAAFRLRSTDVLKEYAAAAVGYRPERPAKTEEAGSPRNPPRA